MHVYMINFPDSSIYIGATTSKVDKRVRNHNSKWKSGKYTCRKLYQKMSEFNGEYTYKELGKYNSSENMWGAEKAYISLFASDLLLNNSTGGSASSSGKTVKRSTIDKMLSSKGCKKEYFKVYSAKSKKLLYSGSSLKECELETGIPSSTICIQLKKIRNGIAINSNSKRKYIVKILQGVGYPNSIQ